MWGQSGWEDDGLSRKGILGMRCGETRRRPVASRLETQAWRSELGHYGDTEIGHSFRPRAAEPREDKQSSVGSSWCTDREGLSEALTKGWSREKILRPGDSVLPWNPENEYANLHLFFWKEG